MYVLFNKSFGCKTAEKGVFMKMILNKFSVLFTVVMIVALIGCGSKPAAAPAAAAPSPATGAVATPPWVNDFPPNNDVIWGIGTAKQSSPSFSMTTAENRARVAVARQLQQKVQNMFNDFNHDAGNARNQASAALQEDVSRQITNIDVSGARPIKRWQAPDGTWWYLVEFKTSDAKNAVAGILRNEEAAFAQFKAQQALQMLDAQLAKQEKPIVVDN